MASEKNADIIVICETWSNSDISNALLSIPGYFIDPDLRLDRHDTTNGIGGGLIVYVKDGIKVSRIPNDNDFNQYLQFVVKGNSHDDDMYVMLVYRSPNSSNLNNEMLNDVINSCPKNCFIFGDFNFPDINWQLGTGKNCNKMFLETIDKKDLTQIIDFPTHSKGNILDLVLTDVPEKVIDVQNVGYLGSSDHCILLLDVMNNCNFNDTCQTRPDWNKADLIGLELFLESTDWTEMNDLDTENSWLFFKNKVHEGIDSFVPKNPCRKKGRPCWMNANVKKMSRKKQKLWKKHRKCNTPESFDEYKKANKDFKRAVKNAKRSFEKKLSKEENLKSFNAYVKTKTKNHVPIGPLKLNDVTLSDSKDIAETLNKYFSSVFTCEDLFNVPDAPRIDPNCTLYSTLFSPHNIEKKIDKLKSTPACGPDGISTLFLKQFKSILKDPLCILFNKSMSEGTVPNDWRCANVTPIFKNKGSKSDCSNYRPVSLTSIPCRLMESCIKETIVPFLLGNNLLNLSQHGFLPKRSCLTNLLEFFEFVTANIDIHQPIDCVYLDFSKAFDKVPVERLLRKLYAHGISGQLLQWLKAWLSDRKQRVVINGKASEWTNVSSGVPQGSVLGPLAFLIFIDDLDAAAEPIGMLNKFADDTKVGHIVKSPSDQAELQNCLNRLCDWANRWGMQFNEKKCNVIHFGHHNNKYEYSMNGVKLSDVDSERDVGVKISSSLKPTQHCSEIVNKSKAILRQIARAFHFRDKVVFVKLYKTYVRCHLEYCTPAWSPSNQTDIDHIESVQKKAVGMVSGLQARDYEGKLKELNLQTLSARRERFDMIQTYKIVHKIDNVSPSTWFDFVPTNRQISTRLTSCELNLVAKRCNLDIRKNFFSQRVISNWNVLPEEIKRARTLKTFKFLYDEHVKNHNG